MCCRGMLFVGAIRIQCLKRHMLKVRSDVAHNCPYSILCARHIVVQQKRCSPFWPRSRNLVASVLHSLVASVLPIWSRAGCQFCARSFDCALFLLCMVALVCCNAAMMSVVRSLRFDSKWRMVWRDCLWDCCHRSSSRRRKTALHVLTMYRYIFARV